MNFRNAVAKTSTQFLRFLDPEVSHEIGARILRLSNLTSIFSPRSDEIESLIPSDYSFSFSEMKVSSPIGLAAGFDKNATMMSGLESLGFGSLELGTVTPLPQPGNPKPRLFRLPEQAALINRMGFNSDGLDLFTKRLTAFYPERKIPIGVNVGKNKLTPPELAVRDFVLGLTSLSSLCDYAVVNVSSPNTPGLRLLGTPDFITAVRSEVPPDLAAKTWIKLDSDRSVQELILMGKTITDLGFAGMILSNTKSVTEPEAGGLSGPPLFDQSYRALSQVKQTLAERIQIIGCGGISKGEHIKKMLDAGACYLQIYTSMIYRGPWVVWELLNEFRAVSGSDNSK